jgi:hypothetical protein
MGNSVSADLNPTQHSVDTIEDTQKASEERAALNEMHSRIESAIASGDLGLINRTFAEIFRPKLGHEAQSINLREKLFLSKSLDNQNRDYLARAASQSSAGVMWAVYQWIKPRQDARYFMRHNFLHLVILGKVEVKEKLRFLAVQDFNMFKDWRFATDARNRTPFERAPPDIQNLINDLLVPTKREEHAAQVSAWIQQLSQSSPSPAATPALDAAAPTTLVVGSDSDSDSDDVRV